MTDTPDTIDRIAREAARAIVDTYIVPKIQHRDRVIADAATTISAAFRKRCEPLVKALKMAAAFCEGTAADNAPYNSQIAEALRAALAEWEAING